MELELWMRKTRRSGARYGEPFLRAAVLSGSTLYLMIVSHRVKCRPSCP